MSEVHKVESLAPGRAARRYRDVVGPFLRAQRLLLALLFGVIVGCGGADTGGPDESASTITSSPGSTTTPGSPSSPSSPSVAPVTAWSAEELFATRLGGATTATGRAALLFGAPAPGLDSSEQEMFFIGERLFQRPWGVAPGSDPTMDGLGPLFNAQSCAACHIRTGRGLPPHPSSQLVPLGLLLRLSIPGTNPETGEPLGDPIYGLQLQDRSGQTLPAEGKLAVTYETIVGRYGDGSTYLLDAPTYTVTDPAFGSLHEEVMISPRFAQQVIGMGLLEGIPDAALLAQADPNDADGDGISGRVNRVWDSEAAATVIGRFGWKANIGSVEVQVADAFHGDLGISSRHRPDQVCPPDTAACLAAPTGASPGGTELTDSQLEAVTFYNRTLAIPAARASADNPPDAQVQQGATAFLDFGCAACHTPVQRTGPNETAALSNQTFAPYTDLLLHDMGEGLADGRPDFLASGSEWRTPPLWGLGLIDDTSGERFLLHDGRAATIEAAILWHGGEAEPAREAFRLAALEEREALLAFLETR